MALIGSLLAEGALGGVAGAGQGTAAVAKEWTSAINEKEKQDAISLREQNLAAINNAAAMDRTQVTEAGANQRTATTEAGATTRQQQGFTHAEKLQDAQQKFMGEQNAERNKLTSQEISSRERIAAANNSTALQVAKIGGSVTQDTQGNVLWVGKDGTAQKIMDPNNPGKPLQSYKDLTPAAKQYADVLKAQLVDLDKQETAAASMGNQEAQAKIVERRAALNGELLNVLTGGISAAGKGAPKAAPTPQDISILKKNPSAKALFDQKFGAGAADRALGSNSSSNSPQSSVEGRPLYSKSTTELTRLAGRPKGVSSADAEEAQRELDARKGESRMSAG